MSSFTAHYERVVGRCGRYLLILDIGMHPGSVAWLNATSGSLVVYALLCETACYFPDLSKVSNRPY